jgi:hypothetical protein
LSKRSKCVLIQKDRDQLGGKKESSDEISAKNPKKNLTDESSSQYRGWEIGSVLESCPFWNGAEQPPWYLALEMLARPEYKLASQISIV